VCSLAVSAEAVLSPGRGIRPYVALTNLEFLGRLKGHLT
jgi:hypothetical protein